MPSKAKPTPKRPSRTGRSAKAAPKRKAPTKKAAKATPREVAGDGSRLVDQRIKDQAGWQGQTLARVRALIREADPEVEEDVKWRKPSNAMKGVPVWSHGGLLCTGETYKDKVKLTFAKGAALEDPARLFNADDKGSTRRAIDLREGDTLDPRAFKELVRSAIALNGA